MKSRPEKCVRVLICIFGCSMASAFAQPIAPTDLGTIGLGAKIVGPVGPEVDTTVSFDDNGTVTGIADLISSVSCDDRFDDCSAESVADQVVTYTYEHQVTPGVDLPNDPPFPSPGTIVPLDDVSEFRLTFPAHGFNGVAGFSFSDSTSAIGDTDISIERLVDGSLKWSIADGSGWDTGEPITFFWQSSQRPTGPTGIYLVSNSILSGTGNGPIPAQVPEPTEATLLSGILIMVILFRRRGMRTQPH